MTDPARWNALNDSERALLRAATSYGKATPVRFMEWLPSLCDSARALTSDDPPQGEIEMPELPEGWTCSMGQSDPRQARFYHPLLGCVHATPNGLLADTRVPWAIVERALALRSAGWRVEGPR